VGKKPRKEDERKTRTKRKGGDWPTPKEIRFEKRKSNGGSARNPARAIPPSGRKMAGTNTYMGPNGSRTNKWDIKPTGVAGRRYR